MSFRDDMNVLGKIEKSSKKFSVPIEKEVIKIDQDSNEDNRSYKI